jgi:enamine deaminase RidA (YjgF/YER057c/UK114 family)
MADPIRRLRGQAAGRSRGSVYRDLVWTVATAPDRAQGIAGQTQQCLAALDKSLAEAGSGKTRILSAQIFLADMATKAEMDAVWNAWIGPDPDHWPQRACVGAPLADGCLVEIILTAAKT